MKPEELSSKIRCLSSETQVNLLKIWLKDIRHNRKMLKKMCSLVLEACYSKKPNRIVYWMERIYEREMEMGSGLQGLKPENLASQYRRINKLDLAMLPYLEDLARKVKNKVRMRVAREKASA